MSQPSNWELPPTGKRLITPKFIRQELHQHPLSQSCYPTAMGFYPEAHGHFMAREQHDDNLLMLCTQGNGVLETDNHYQPIEAGDVVLLPVNQAHSYRADAHQPWTLFWVHFSGQLAEAFMAYVSADRRVIHPGVRPELLSGFQQLLAVERTGYSLGAYITAANQLQLLLTQLADLGEQQSRQGRQEIDIDAIHGHMQRAIAGQVTLEQLASSAGMSRSHFTQRYRELTGYAPMRHFTHLKMEAACRLLDSTRQSVKQVASALGYDDPLYFSRVFRRVVGVSPRAYRRTNSA